MLVDFVNFFVNRTPHEHFCYTGRHPKLSCIIHQSGQKIAVISVNLRHRDRIPVECDMIYSRFNSPTSFSSGSLCGTAIQHETPRKSNLHKLQIVPGVRACAQLYVDIFDRKITRNLEKLVALMPEQHGQPAMYV